MNGMSNKKVLLLAHDGEDFFKARLPFAKFLKDKGYEPFVILPEDHYTEKIREAGFHVEHSRIERDRKNPLNLLKSISEIRRFAADNDVEIIHSFKFVPNLINSCANIFTNKKVVLHIAGLGIAFANKSAKFQTLKFIQQLLFLLQFLRANLVIIQNPDDYNDFFLKSYFRKKIKVVKGSGVNITKFCPPTESNHQYGTNSGKMVFLCTTRLIWEKGIRELVDAFESLPGQVSENIELRIIGEPDTKNPRGVTEEYIAAYRANPRIRFLGRQDNVKEHLQNSHVFILPSYYREGIPRSILEALAVGLPVITTDVPGCNLTILPNKNGILIPPRSTDAIRTAVEKIIAERERWTDMGLASRDLALSEFSENRIFTEIVKLYNQ